MKPSLCFSLFLGLLNSCIINNAISVGPDQKTVDAEFSAVLAKHNSCNATSDCVAVSKLPKCPCPYQCGGASVNRNNLGAFNTDFDNSPILSHSACDTKKCPNVSCTAVIYEPICKASGTCY